MKNIKFDDHYVSEEYGTTTYYFVAPKEMLKELIAQEYPDAVSMEISIEFPTGHPEANVAAVSISPTRYLEDTDSTEDYDWIDINLPLDEIEELLVLAESTLAGAEKKAEPLTFRMYAGIKFNRPIDRNNDYFTTNGYEFVMGGKSIQFDFSDLIGSVNEYDPYILEVELKNPMYELYPDLDVLTQDMLDNVTEIKNFSVFSDSGLYPVKITHIQFVLPYEDWKNIEVSKDVLASFSFNVESCEATKSWYFTFGSDEKYPYGRGEYVVVYAKNQEEAVRRYREKYPNKTEGVYNAAFCYSETEWGHVCEHYIGVFPVDVVNGSAYSAEKHEEIKKALSNFFESSYNEDTEYELDYFIDENKCNEGNTAYLFSHESGELIEMEVLHVIRRSDNPEYYYLLSKDKDILLAGEEKYKADTSAEFLTDKDSYMFWFRHKKLIY